MAPYGEILSQLVESVMRAMAEFYRTENLMFGQSVADAVEDASLNKHFSWLAIRYPEGINRHLFEASLPNHPLRTQKLRHTRSIDESIRTRLNEARAPDPGETHFSDYVRNEPTRISSLIRKAIAPCSGAMLTSKSSHATSNKRQRFVIVPSPISIVYDFLTAPEHPGTRAYALLSIRNYLFEKFKIIPDELPDHSSFTKFSVRDVEVALSAVRTSLRPRYWSKGYDKLPGLGRSDANTFVRHFLSLNGILRLRFENAEQCAQYLCSADLNPARPNFEFDRSPHLLKLPELGELINEIWGLPLPLRGADTIFRGGLKFSARRGLVCAVHGGPGSGKTSLSLGIGASLAGFGIKTIFFTAEEASEDLFRRTNGLLADDVRRLSFIPKQPKDWLTIVRFRLTSSGPSDLMRDLKARFREIADLLNKAQGSSKTEHLGIPSVCHTVVVLDGLHDLATRAMTTANVEQDRRSDSLYQLHAFIDACRELQALVILTTGTDWTADTSLDYLVDVAMRLTHETQSEDGSKPDRTLTLTKARHQLCSPGSHGLQIAGEKGVRFTPQMNYQLDRRAIWSTRLPDRTVVKTVMQLATDSSELWRFPSDSDQPIRPVRPFRFVDSSVLIFKGSNIFLNGEGSGGKAALALKIATAPSLLAEDISQPVSLGERVLIISFLYPEEYYADILGRLTKLMAKEYVTFNETRTDPRIEVIHLYPGHLKPSVLFNRIEWALQAADLEGDAFTTVLIDGIHNVFLQFPEIERQSLFWPQLFSMLRTRDLLIISTHTLLTVGRDVSSEDNKRVDDRRSDPLRHALVQKTDFRFDIGPKEVIGNRVRESNAFVVRTLSAIGQTLPSERDPLYWSRERLVLFDMSQKSFPFNVATES